jgi:hypothetical protein
VTGETNMLDLALTYAEKGWCVFPLRPSGKQPLAELAPQGLKNATTDADTIRRWWGTRPDANIGIRTGAESGLVVLDVDKRHGGMESLADFCEAHGDFGPTLRVRTGGGGDHFYFAHDGNPIPNTAGRIGEGIDSRGDGGYVVGPGSISETGAVYEVIENGVIAPLPDTLKQAMLTRPGKTPKPAALPSSGVSVAEGLRNVTLTSLAGKLRRDGWQQDEIEAALQVRNAKFRPPLDASEVARIAESIASYEPAVRETPMETTEFSVYKLNEFLQLPDAEESLQLLGPLIVRGARTTIGADSGHGKSTLVSRVLKVLVDGGEFLTWESDGGNRVLVVDAEMGAHSIKRQYREAAVEHDDRVDLLTIPDGLALDTSEAQCAAFENILAAGGYDVVVLDPLFKLYADADSNDERAVVKLMRKLDGWREQYKFALVMCQHTRKPGMNVRFTMHDLFGSSAFVRGAEVVLGLQRPGMGRAELHFFKDREGQLPVGTYWKLLFDRETGYSLDPAAGIRELSAKELVAMTLRSGQRKTFRELHTGTQKSETAVRNALREIGATATDDAKPVYYLTPEAEAKLSFRIPDEETVPF